MGTEVSTTENVADIDFGDGVTEAHIDAIINSGDAAAIEALMRGEVPQNVASIETTQTQTEVKSGEEESAASGATEVEQSESSETNGTEVNAPVLTKDGQRTIPYEVLEVARTKAKTATEEVTSLRAQLAEHESKSQLVTKFLEKRGIDPAAITEEQAEELTADDIRQLEELDPIVGKAIRVLQSRPVVEPQPAAQPATTDNPVLDAIKANTDLSAWRNSDQDRWDFAVSVDEKLKADPKFSSHSLEERFAEAARRTRIAFGDEQAQAPNKDDTTAEVAAKKVAAAAKAVVPSSLTSLGITPTSERSLTEQLAELSPQEIEERMAKMTPAQLQEVLGGIE